MASEPLMLPKPSISAESCLAALVQSSEDAIIDIDLNGVVLSWNPAAERMFGYAPNDVLGRPMAAIIPAASGEEQDHVLPCVRAGLAVDRFETVRLRKDGSLIDISLTVSPVKNASGTVVHALAIARDLSDRNRLLELRRVARDDDARAQGRDLDEQNRRMQEANRLKGEFVANMSHELRTPLNSIIGFAEVMRNEKANGVSAQYREFLGDILASSRHLLRLINDILDLAKVEAGKIDFVPERVDLMEIVGEIREIVRGPATMRRIDVTSSVDPEVRTVYIDPSRFKQVLYNYMSNAVKFTPEGGRVVVRVTPGDNGTFRLAVEDTGIGIRAGDLHKLFIEFQQLDASTTKRFAGTGLGLAMTKRIIEAQGGAVGVESEVGVGSTFWALLPCRVPALTVAAAGQAVDETV
jgi:PAS domain S-box-containing protein